MTGERVKCGGLNAAAVSNRVHVEADWLPRSALSSYTLSWNPRFEQNK